ncbi:hypothetical protein GCM10027451_16150 [Geodermatophilus aquaeductus]
MTGFLQVASDAGDMGRGSSASYRARRQERERQRRERAAQADAKEIPARRTWSANGAASGDARRAAASSCAWCGGVIQPRSRGPIPKWCSATCRHRAWEQTRAAASGRAALQVVERRVEVPTDFSPSRQAWPQILRELTRQLHDGRVYDRDLGALSVELGSLLEAYRHLQRLRGAPDLR